MSQTDRTPEELYRENLRKRKDLEKEAKELVWKILSDEMKKLALDAFGDDIDTACEWMMRRRLPLDERSPIDLLLDGEVNWVSGELNAIIHGIYR